MSLNPDAILYYSTHPVEFVEDIIRAKPDARQKDMLQSVADNPLTSVRSGHGVGKSAVESWLIIWFLSTSRTRRFHVRRLRSISYTTFFGPKSPSG